MAKYYKLTQEVSVEVRSSEDPYMVFAYTRDSLGTDFTIFLFLAIACSIIAFICSIIVIYYYCCFLEKSEDYLYSAKGRSQAGTQNGTQEPGFYSDANMN